MWETNIAVDSKVEYGLTKEYGKTVFVPKIEKSPYPGWEHTPEGIYLQTAKITNLDPDTVYEYRVISGNDVSPPARFKTLPESDPVRFVVVNDSHRFDTAENFTRHMLEYKPDFIAHAGDIAVGYGFSYYEFVDHWFNRAPELVRNFPVCVAIGNHDIGPFFHAFFSKQADDLFSGGDGRWFSFNIAGIHFIFMDSNLASPVLIPDEWEKQYHWFKENIASDAFKEARWRFTFTHHQYFHPGMHEHFVPLVEENDIDVHFGGHTHSHFKMASQDPDIGTRSMFLIPGDLQNPGWEIRRGSPAMRGYPGSLAIGAADYISVEIEGDEMLVRVHTTIPDRGEGPYGILNEFTLHKEEPRITFENFEVSPESIQAGDEVNVKITATNNGKGLITVPLKLHVNGEEITKYIFDTKEGKKVHALNPGESKEIETTIRLYDTGTNEISAAGLPPKKGEVDARAPDFIYHNLNITLGEGIHSNRIEASAEVQNRGSYEGTKDIVFYINNHPVATEKRTLGPGERRTVTFLYRFERSGTQLVTVGDLKAEQVEIPGFMKLKPIVPDRSGFDNHGILRGNPKWSDANKSIGKAVVFDGIHDYVEIPDNESLHITDEFTAVVWANIHRLAKSGEADHNPILGKGPTFGWGPNYLLRMVYRRTGGTTFGTSFGSVEFAWEGGYVKQNEWTQYLSSYDGSTGRAFIDLMQVAESRNGETPLNYWEGYPLLSGLGYVGNIHSDLERGIRPTMLAGEIGEIRLYNSHLSPEERKQIFQSPGEAGPGSEYLVVWLDFNDVITEGRHETEWRRPLPFEPSYAGEKRTWNWDYFEAEANIPKGSEVKVRIQVSNDGTEILDSMEMNLKEGLHVYDLTDLHSAQYIKITTFLNGELTSERSSTPGIDHYKITAEERGASATIFWDTQADWLRGDMTPAVGFEKPERLLVGE